MKNMSKVQDASRSINQLLTENTMSIKYLVHLKKSRKQERLEQMKK